MKHKANKHSSDASYDISAQIEVLKIRFQPARNEAEATHWYSTEEVVEAIKDIDPGAKVDASLVHDALLEAGFIYRIRPASLHIAFRWMMRATD